MQSCVIPRFQLSAFILSTPDSEPFILLAIPDFRMAMARVEAEAAVQSDINGEFIQLWGAPAGEDAYGVVVSWSIFANN